MTILQQEYTPEPLHSPEGFIDVAETALREDVYFLHGIHPTAHVQGNSPLLTHVSFEDKAAIAIGLEPDISVSSIKRGTNQRPFTPIGLIVSRGNIEEASNADAGTTAKSISDRKREHSRMSGTLQERLQQAINSNYEWNELVIGAPGFAGIYIHGRWLEEREVDGQTLLVAPEATPHVRKLRENFDLPLFVLRGGVMIAVEIDERGVIILGEEIAPAELSAMTLVPTHEDRVRIIDKVKREALINIKSDAQRLINRSNSGAGLYFLANRLAGIDLDRLTSTTLEELGATNFFIHDPRPAMRAKIEPTDSVRILGETVVAGQQITTITFFEHNGKVYILRDAEVSIGKTARGKMIFPIDNEFQLPFELHGLRPSHYPYRLQFNPQEGITNWDDIDVVGLIAGSVEPLLEEVSKARLEPDVIEEYRAEIVENAAFMLYGYAAMASSFGNYAEEMRAIQTAEQLGVDVETFDAIMIKHYSSETGRKHLLDEDLVRFGIDQKYLASLGLVVTSDRDVSPTRRLF